MYRIGFVLLRVLSQLFRPRTRGVKCLVAHGDAVLVVFHSYGAKQWDLAGGFCRPREQFEVTARRELAEELGVTVITVSDLGELRRAQYGRHETLRLFRVDVDDRELAIDLGELVDARWCDRDELPSPRATIVDLAVAREADLLGQRSVP
jgi:8-oxo-dGTP pyrophosphatase MutT (NUDIX family)